MHSRPLNATGCATTHPEETLQLWVSAKLCHRGPQASDAASLNRAQVLIPKDGECLENAGVWEMWFSLLVTEHNFQKVLCDQN